MTFQTIQNSLPKAAADAAQASVDAHGSLIGASAVWDFLHTVCDDTEGDTYGYMLVLPDTMPSSFPTLYRRAGVVLARRIAEVK